MGDPPQGIHPDSDRAFFQHHARDKADGAPKTDHDNDGLMPGHLGIDPGYKVLFGKSFVDPGPAHTAVRDNQRCYFPVNAIIADDEPELRRYLRAALNKTWPELEICAEADNGPRALSLIEQYHPRIAFLDIRMPGMSGMDVARKVGGGCRVVFITAYDQYTVEAFEAEAVGYLPKPGEIERLAQTVARLKQQMQSDPEPGGPLTERLLQALDNLNAARSAPQYLQWVRAPQRDGLRLIPTVITRDGEFLIRKPLRELAAELDPDLFWRIHRSTIFNVAYVERVSRFLKWPLYPQAEKDRQTSYGQSVLRLSIQANVRSWLVVSVIDFILR